MSHELRTPLSSIEGTNFAGGLAGEITEKRRNC
jgi:signal transduction histidine kinase